MPSFVGRVYQQTHLFCGRICPWKISIEQPTRTESPSNGHCNGCRSDADPAPAPSMVQLRQSTTEQLIAHQLCSLLTKTAATNSIWHLVFCQSRCRTPNVNRNWKFKKKSSLDGGGYLDQNQQFGSDSRSISCANNQSGMNFCVCLWRPSNSASCVRHSSAVE